MRHLLSPALILATCSALYLGPVPGHSEATQQRSEAAQQSRPTSQLGSEPMRLRVMTFNLEDVRTTDLAAAQQPRLQAAAAVIQQLRPDIVLLSEVAYDQPGTTGWQPGAEPGQNGQRFADRYLAKGQRADLEGLSYRAFMAPSNTGEPSGFDLDNDGQVVSQAPAAALAGADGAPAPQTAAGRAYGNDSWGFGTFAGQYSMALLVRKGLEIDHAAIRTFRLLPWRAMPGALEPIDPQTDEPWYSAAEWAAFRLSSKSHWDVPVKLPNGAVLHLLASHPTPPAFDGPEGRNRKRNHDEIRLWADYLSNAEYIADDQGRRGGLADGAAFVLLGDLNADPEGGSSIDDPIGRLLLAHPRIQDGPAPTADSAGRAAFPGLAGHHTARWRRRVDYVLPATGLRVLGSGIWRPRDAALPNISDHFPVWIDLEIEPADGSDSNARGAS